MSNVNFKIKDNSKAFLDAKNDAIERALEEIGQQAESYAKINITKAGRVDTGDMRNSVAHTVKGESVYIGTNIEYAVYNEIGTGIYLDPQYGQGRQDPWVWFDDKGRAHRTRGMKPIHFLKNAAANHTDEYKRIAEEYLKGNA